LPTVGFDSIGGEFPEDFSFHFSNMSLCNVSTNAGVFQIELILVKKRNG
jgi:hypothetical protein